MFARPSITHRLVVTVFALAALLLVLLAALYTVFLLNTALWEYSSIGRLVKIRWIETRIMLDHFVEQSASLLEQQEAWLSAPALHKETLRRKAHQGANSGKEFSGNRQYIQMELDGAKRLSAEAPACEQARLEFKDFDERYWNSQDVPVRAYLLIDDCRGILVSADSQQRIDIPVSPNASQRLASLVAQARLAGASGPQRLATSERTWFGPVIDPFNGRQILGRMGLLRDMQGNSRGLIFTAIDSSTFSERFRDNDADVVFGLFAPNGNLVFSNQAFPVTKANALEGLPSYDLRPDTGRVMLFGGHVWLSFRSPDTGWRLVYGVQYRKLLASHYPDLIACIFALGVSLFGLLLFWRFLTNQVVVPAIRTGQQLIESETFNRTILETAPVGVCVLRLADSCIAHQNEKARTLLKTKDDTHAERLILTHVGEQDNGNIQLELAGKSQSDIRYVQVAYARTRYQGEAVLLCALTDISAQKQIEGALLAARQAADQASEAKSAFLAMMSHEIRTPLYGMLGTLELLSQGELVDAQRAQLQTVELSSRTLLSIINDLLDVSKIDAGQMALESTKLDLPGLVERCVRSVAPLARKKGIDLYCHIQPEFPRALLGDEVRLQQVLNNLLGNAVKFTDNGKIVVRLSAREQSAKQIEFALQISDSGIGISERDRERLFEPFSQADTSTARRFGGTGLGLSICRRLVGLMGGRIELVSEFGLGSSFTVICSLRCGEDEEVRYWGSEDLGNVFVMSASGEERDMLIALARFAGGRATAFNETLPSDRTGVLVATSKVSLPDDVDQRFSGVVLVRCDAPQMPERIDSSSVRWQVSAYAQDAIVAALRLARNLPGHVPIAPEPTVPKIPSLRILVVEDHPINQRLLSAQLEKLGCTVTLASNGKKALDCWQEGVFDIVLSDINMPDLDGYGLVRQLRSLGAQLPIIGLTAYTDAGVRKRAEEAGFDSLTIKPISLESLASALNAQIPSSLRAASVANTVNTPLPPDCIPETIRDVFRTTMAGDLAQLDSCEALEDLESVRTCAHRMRGALAVLRDEYGIALCEAIENGAIAANKTSGLSSSIRKLGIHLERALK